MPWTGDPGFEAVLAGARRPLANQSLPPSLAHSTRTFVNERSRIYAAELWESVLLLFGVLAVGWWSDRGHQRGGAVKCALFVLTVIDLLVLSRHRLIGVGPLRPLVEQSPTLARLAQEPRGTRVANGRLRNLPMLIEIAPISAYRTLDVPVVTELTTLAHGPLGDPAYEPDVWAALRATGTGLRVFDPLENRLDELRRRVVTPRETIDDPALASWQLDNSWLADQGPWARKFSIWRAEERPAKAWLVREIEVAEPKALDAWSGDPREILQVLKRAQPLATESSRPEEWTIPLTADEPAWVIVSQLADPAWRARWIRPDGASLGEDDILPTFRKVGKSGGWQRLKVPAPGRWTLRLEYDAREVAAGLAISTVAWMSWLTAAAVTVLRAARGRFLPPSKTTEA
jgi:hypothetical protein